MCGGDWEILHRGPRKRAGQQGPVQEITAAIKAGTPELQCKTYEEAKRLLPSGSASCSTCKGPTGAACERNRWLLINFIRHTPQTFIDSGTLSLSGSYNLELAIFRLPS